MSRLISHSEVSAALQCQAKHDYRYVGQLAGSALNPKTTPVLLREGKAWGAGVAAYHATGDDSVAHLAMREVLDEDAGRLKELSLFMPEEHDETVSKLVSALNHYISSAERMPIGDLEKEIVTPINDGFDYQCFFDGVYRKDDGHVWLVEFKLRKSLSSFEQVVLSRQIRWYAWAYFKDTGEMPTGVIVDERLNAAPKPVKLNQDGRPSKTQSCTVEDYREMCERQGFDVAEDVVAKLSAKRWQQRFPVIFRPDEIEEAGRQLESACKLISALDGGELYPIPNPSQFNCGGCSYRDICSKPVDAEFIDELFERVPAKKDRKIEKEQVK